MSIEKLSPERRREIASQGGRALRREQRSFSQNRELAREAGRKGGSAPRRKRSQQVDSMIDDVPRGA